MTDSAPKRARDIARAALIGEITDTARRHLADSGAAGLSLRAVSRELGMVSSAIYRYFPSRDALLTQLIIDAYNSLGDAAERAESAVERSDHLGRFRALAHAVRDWARTNPHEYALIYGSPVPGYAAPQDTIDPAIRVTVLLTTVLADADEAGAVTPPAAASPAGELLAQIQVLIEALGRDVDPTRLLVGIGVWAQLYGMINFELFGQFANTFDDADDLFAAQVDLMAVRMGVEV